jgi:hypothetical protein
VQFDTSSHFSGFESIGTEPYQEGLKRLADAYADIGDGDWMLPNLHRFASEDEPPSAPADEHWKYTKTTHHVQTEKPREGHKIGNYLLDFLVSKEVESEVIKVRAPSDKKSRESNVPKFSIKADVFIENIMCTIKIRVYKDKRDNWYCVEFQRRRGDCVTFNNAYRRARAYLRVRTGSPSPMKTDEVEPLQISEYAAGLLTQDEIEITPLLDMAGMIHMPTMQADSATALADLAQDRKRAALLCTDRAFEQFKSLLHSDQTAVAYPISRTLSSLAERAEAAQHFVKQGILQIILEKVQSKATCALVQNSLVQTLSVAVSQCVSLLSEADVKALLDGLSAAVKAGPVKDEKYAEGEKAAHETFYQNLQEVKSKLQHRDGAKGMGACGDAFPAQATRQ